MKTMTTFAILTVLVTAATHAQAQSDSERQLAAENYAQADQNGDGLLSRAEFVQFIDLNAADNLGRSGQLKASGRYDMAFNRLDANDDDMISPAEMQR